MLRYMKMKTEWICKKMMNLKYQALILIMMKSRNLPKTNMII